MTKLSFKNLFTKYSLNIVCLFLVTSLPQISLADNLSTEEWDIAAEQNNPFQRTEIHNGRGKGTLIKRKKTHPCCRKCKTVNN